MTDPIPGHEHLEGRLAIPYLTDEGPVNITFRCIQSHDCKEVSHHEKYMFPKGYPTNLYGVRSISWADDWIVLTEGEIDCLTWIQMGVPALGVSGAKKWQPHWVNVLEDFSRIYVAADGDAAGKEMWDRVSYEVTNVIKVPMLDGEDSNSMYVKYGPDALLSRIKK